MKKLVGRKKGLSPVVTSVLLIALVIAITSVVFLWFKGIVEEDVTKFGKNIKLVCEDVNFDATYSSGVLNIVNTGNTPIYMLNIKMVKGGSYETKEIIEISGGEDWPDGGLNQGGSFSGSIGSEVVNLESMIILPVLIGTSGEGKKTFMCGEQYGKEIDV